MQVSNINWPIVGESPYMSSANPPNAIILKLGDSPHMELTKEDVLAVIDAGIKKYGTISGYERAAGLAKQRLKDIKRAKGVPPASDWEKMKAAVYSNNDKPEIPQVPVVGEIGAGEKFFPYDDHMQGASLEEVDPPNNCENCVAVKIRGDSMKPLKPGCLIFYEKYADGVPSECLGELCVVKLADESMMLKVVKSGSLPHHYHLISWNDDFKPILDQKLLWASKVKDIRPG